MSYAVAEIELKSKSRANIGLQLCKSNLSVAPAHGGENDIDVDLPAVLITKAGDLSGNWDAGEKHAVPYVTASIARDSDSEVICLVLCSTRC